MLNEVPMRGMPMPPTDTLIYRFYELVMVNGPAWKALIEEEFGDGIMSAVDFDLTLDRLANAKGDQVQLTMSGKFFPTNITTTSKARPSTASRRNDGRALCFRSPTTMLSLKRYAGGQNGNCRFPNCTVTHFTGQLFKRMAAALATETAVLDPPALRGAMRCLDGTVDLFGASLLRAGEHLARRWVHIVGQHVARGVGPLAVNEQL